MPRLSVHDIHNKEFKRTLRGYDVNEVNDFLDFIIKDYIEFESLSQKGSQGDDDERFLRMEQLLEHMSLDIQDLLRENRELQAKIDRMQAGKALLPTQVLKPQQQYPQQQYPQQGQQQQYPQQQYPQQQYPQQGQQQQQQQGSQTQQQNRYQQPQTYYR